MSRDEWESLCDHCGKCCLIKLEDEEDGQVYYTDIVCDLFQNKDCHCGDYWNRETLVPTCIRLTQDNLDDISWMPPSCAYRSIQDQQGLPEWHHLVSGDKKSIHRAGHSVKGRTIFEKEIIGEEEYEEHIVEWPLIEENVRHNPK
ncbi:MAG TPA: YcgN family cysteine cluster protein [Leucothrix mucor]|uniref:YcgN family cysteine cluster protein n=1 Tax=Leucothrix mucor TaxID=45248 RepID=A0A7V2SXM3_LEUMU|nr:YcgN family cysteine cluster protein [Leucothrix mucor]